MKTAFGKLDPNQYGVLPVLVVIQNDGKEAIRLDRLKVEYVGPATSRVEATPAEGGPLRARRRSGRAVAGPGRQVEDLRARRIRWTHGRSKAARLRRRCCRRGSRRRGFFYFQTELQPGATVYISGMREARTGKELFYFETPLQ